MAPRRSLFVCAAHSAAVALQSVSRGHLARRNVAIVREIREMDAACRGGAVKLVSAREAHIKRGAVALR